MKFFNTLLLTGLAVLTSVSAQANCPARNVTVEEQRALFDGFVRTFILEKNPIKAFESYIHDNYIQHNPNALSGKQNAINAFRNINLSGFRYTLISKGFDNNYGWFHYRLDYPGASQPSAVTDILRYEGSCVIEHWDVSQQRPANPINPIAMF